MSPLRPRPELAGLLLALSPLALLACRAPGARPTPAGEAVEARQIDWQRDLENALALARAQDRPLFLALNMDGESASDRIVREEYRDPAFVAATRDAVCLVASVFRHTARDFDDQGRRVPCPRLGRVTCGEHVALEPLLFERFLADGERVAPRHAWIRADGSKAWDVSLAFDLRDIDRELIASAAAERSRREGRASAASEQGPEASSWSGLVARRDARGRAALEQALERAGDEGSLGAALDALASAGSGPGARGTLDALRVIAWRLPRLSPRLRERFEVTARALGLEVEVAGLLRERLMQLDPLPGEARPEAAALLPLLAALDGDGTTTRSFLLGCRALEGYDPQSTVALEHALGRDALAALEARLGALGGPLLLDELLRSAAAVTRAGAEPEARPYGDALPQADELVQALEELDATLRTRPGEPELLARYAKAALDLARRRIETGDAGAQSLLEDAEAFFARALGQEPQRPEWWIERARAAYFRSAFEEQAQYGRRALALAAALAPGELPDETALWTRDGTPAALLGNTLALEALRWIGDADARLLAARAGGDPAQEGAGALEGLRCLGLVAASPRADAQDWLSFASLAGALGLVREELAIVRVGAERLPADRELRQRLNDGLWRGGRLELVPGLADELARSHPLSADAAWFAGYAWILAAESARRAERPEQALGAYAAAQERFARAAALRPDYAASAAHYVALSWLGRGLAQARAGRRARAADCLVELVQSGVPLAGVPDGLGYDVLDLVDKTLEWRADGPSPVDPLELLARLAEVGSAQDPYWALAVSDSELREALRADGRNPVRAMRDTVDAAGAPIRMLLGLPDDEGDAYLRSALAAARSVKALLASDEDRKVLAQADTIWAERNLERERLEGVHECLQEACELLGVEPPPTGADTEALRDVAARLRAQLGEARPRWRLGR